MVNRFVSLRNIFESLLLVESESVHFAAQFFPNRTSDFVAKDKEGYPAILIAVPQSDRSRMASPVVLEHLTAQHNLQCRLRQPDGRIHNGTFTVIKCVNADRELKRYFLEIMFPVVQTLPSSPSQVDISSLISHVAELFRNIVLPGRKSIQGLWAELFLIAYAKNPDFLVQAWHKTPKDLYDFCVGAERVEMKSSSSIVRAHHFSYSQLNPEGDVRVLVASIFVEEADTGKSIYDLVELIKKKIRSAPQLVQRVDQVVAATLGSGWKKALHLRFDNEMAGRSLVYFDVADIPSIQGPLPPEISHVHFKSDLSGIEPVDLKSIAGESKLFLAL